MLRINLTIDQGRKLLISQMRKAITEVQNLNAADVLTEFVDSVEQDDKKHHLGLCLFVEGYTVSYAKNEADAQFMARRVQTNLGRYFSKHYADLYKTFIAGCFNDQYIADCILDQFVRTTFAMKLPTERAQRFLNKKTS